MVDDVDIFEPGLAVTVPLPATKGDETFLRGASSIYNFLAPSDERQAELDQLAADREDVLERLGIDKAQATRMLGFGDERGQLLEDMGFQPRTIKEDFDRFREFMYGAQQSGFKKRADGVAHEDLTMEEKIGQFMLPIDVLDVVGLGFGVKQLVKLGIKKFGSGSNKSVIDLANDESIVNQMSNAEAKDLMKDLQPVLGGEQNVFLRYAKKPKVKKKRAAPELKQMADVEMAVPPPSVLTKTEVPTPKQKEELPTLPQEEDLEVTIPLATENFLFTDDLQNLKPVKKPKDTKVGQKQRKTEMESLADSINKSPDPLNDVNILRQVALAYLRGQSSTNLLRQSLDNPEIYKDLISRAREVNLLPASKQGIGLKTQGKEKQKLRDKDVKDKANKALDYLTKLQKNAPGKIKVGAPMLYETLSKEFPDLFPTSRAQQMRKEDIQAMKDMEPKLKKFLIKKGEGRVITDPDTLIPKPIDPDVEYRKNVELMKKVAREYPDEVITDLQNPNVPDLLQEGADLNDPEFAAVRLAGDNKDFVRFSQNPTFKFYQYLRDTLPSVSLNRLFNNVKIGDPTDLANPAQRMFNNFKKLEDTRKEVSKKLRPFLQRVFGPYSKNISLQIAHTFEKGKLTKALEGKSIEYDPEKFIGEGANPDFLYLDISAYNQDLQPSLEAMAREFSQQGNFEQVDKISQLMELMGVEGQIRGQKLGKKRKLSTKLLGLIDELEKRGDPLPERKELLEAIDILKLADVEGFSVGGMVEDDRINIFEDDMPEGSFQVASLKLPFFKMFGKPPINEVAPIPVPKEKLTNPTKKQTQSLENEREKIQEVFDPTPDEKIDLAGETIEVTPYTKQPMTSIFYSDVERVLARPDTPETFANKQAVIDFFNKNRIKKTELEDYRIGPLLKLFEDNAPIPKAQIIRQVRQAPIKGLKLHATGSGSEIINPGREVPVRYSGYAEDGFIGGTQRERVLYINKKDLPGDPGTYPTQMFGGESVPRHEFQIPSEDDTYIVGWSRLTDRMGILPTKLEAPKTKSNIPGLKRERDRAQRQVSGLYAEAVNKLNREGVRRGLNQADLELINELSLERMLSDYGDILGELSPGLVDQIDELIVKARDLDTEIAKGSAVDTSGIVKVAFVDEMQSDIMQKATERKQQLAAALRKIQEEGEGTTIEGLNRQARQVVDFFEKNKTVFRPLEKTEEEAAKIGEKIRGLDERVDEIVRDYIDTREISQANINELQTLLNDNINSLLNEIIEIDSSTVDKLFPDLPFKNRDEWADAIVKSNLYELAYKKFVLKEADAPEYYAITPSRLVSKRYSFVGDTATPAADRAEDKARRIQQFKNEGTFGASRFKGIGMAEFYGGPKAVDESGKHYTSTLEKILKKQAKENNSEIVTMPVQTRAGGDDVFRITDQNGNMVATLTDERQANLVLERNPNYKVERMRVPDEGSTTPVFAIKITKEMLEPYKTHKAMGGLVQIEDIFEV